VPADETLDAISGHFRIFQGRAGHRFSTDDVLTAWYGTTWAPRASSILDLGSGIGSVGMIAAWRLPGARVVTIEAQEESVRLARKSAAYNGLESRYEIRHGDFREGASDLSAVASAKAEDPPLRAEERYDLILGSPPYFPLDAGIHGDHPQKVACRFELRGDIGDYATVAARHLSLGGVFACVFPEEQLQRIEAAARDAELTIVRRRPVVFKEGEAPLVGVLVMMRRNDLPEVMRERTWIEPPLIIRCHDGRVHPEYSAVKLAIGFPP
jgi:tRNA1(Val) A37 N6-methylase TrmN6